MSKRYHRYLTPDLDFTPPRGETEHKRLAVEHEGDVFIGEREGRAKFLSCYMGDDLVYVYQLREPIVISPDALVAVNP